MADYSPKRPNKRGLKGSTGGGGRGFGTPNQAGGAKTAEDSPGVDFRTFGNRRFNRGTRLPGGAVARVPHGVKNDASGRPMPRPDNKPAGSTPGNRFLTRAVRRPRRRA